MVLRLVVVALLAAIASAQVDTFIFNGYLDVTCGFPDAEVCGETFSSSSIETLEADCTELCMSAVCDPLDLQSQVQTSLAESLEDQAAATGSVSGLPPIYHDTLTPITTSDICDRAVDYTAVRYEPFEFTGQLDYFEWTSGPQCSDAGVDGYRQNYPTAPYNEGITVGMFESTGGACQFSVKALVNIPRSELDSVMGGAATGTFRYTFSPAQRSALRIDTANNLHFGFMWHGGGLMQYDKYDASQDGVQRWCIEDGGAWSVGSDIDVACADPCDRRLARHYLFGMEQTLD